MTLKGIVLPGEKPILNYGKEVMGMLRKKVVDVCVCVCVRARMHAQLCLTYRPYKL